MLYREQNIQALKICSEDVESRTKISMRCNYQIMYVFVGKIYTVENKKNREKTIAQFNVTWKQ